MTHAGRARPHRPPAPPPAQVVRTPAMGCEVSNQEQRADREKTHSGPGVWKAPRACRCPGKSGSQGH